MLAGVAHAQTPTTLPASSYPSPIISETAPFTGAVARTNRDKMGDLMDVADFKAKCDGSTDDSVAFQTAANAATSRGQGLQFHGHCVVNSQINVAVSSPSGFTLYGNGSELISHGNNLFNVTKVGSSGYASRFIGFRVTNVGAQTGSPITIDGTQNGVGSSQNDRVEDIDFYNTGTPITAIATSNLVVDRINSQIFGSTSIVGLALSGPTINGTTYYSTNTTVTNWYNVGGQSLLTMSGGVQGVTLNTSRSLDNSGWSVQEVGTGTNFEGVTVLGSYLEGALGGIKIPDAHGITIHGDSFDTSPEYPHLATWASMEIGDPSGTGDPVVGNVITDNTIQPYDMAGMSAPLRYYGGQGNISGNVVLGVASHAVDCMLIDTINLTGSQDNYLSVNGNTCWDAGKFDVQGSLASLTQASGNSATTYNGTMYVPTYYNNAGYLATPLAYIDKLTSNGSGTVEVSSAIKFDFAVSATSQIATPTLFADSISSNGSGTINFNQPASFNFGTTVAFKNVTKSQLPATCTVGAQLFVTDGRNSGEAAGAGSGTEAYCTNKQVWYANGSPVQN